MKMPIKIDNRLIYSIVCHHISHFTTVKNDVKHDYESHMVLLTVYSNFLYQTIVKKKPLSWTGVFNTAESKGHKELMSDRKLTIFAVAENLSMSQETVRRKLDKLCKRHLLNYSKKEGLSLGKKFKETIRPVGKADMKGLLKIFEK